MQAGYAERALADFLRHRGDPLALARQAEGVHARLLEASLLLCSRDAREFEQAGRLFAAVMSLGTGTGARLPPLTPVYPFSRRFPRRALTPIREWGLLGRGIPIKEAPMAGIPRSQGRADPKIGPSDSSDTFSDRPNESTDTDDGGTGERVSTGRDSRSELHNERGVDRVVDSQDAGLGGGLDQAEEGRLGITDEELSDSELDDRVRKPKP